MALTAGFVAAPSVRWFLACTATTGLLVLLLVVAATRVAGLHLQSNHMCTHQKWFNHQPGLINMGRRKQPATVAAGKLLQQPSTGFCVIVYQLGGFAPVCPAVAGHTARSVYTHVQASAVQLINAERHTVRPRLTELPVISC